jgi:catechol 2,3-dioxygenase-like lactoylglutathione lyase family enzyme
MVTTVKKLGPHPARELRSIVPARDFDLSKRFYRAIGFVEDWTNGEIAMFKNGATSFLLRSEPDAAYAAGMQMQLVVDSADDWYTHVASVIDPFGITVAAPVDRPWGARDFVLADPSGVRWRITQGAG